MLRLIPFLSIPMWAFIGYQWGHLRLNTWLHRFPLVRTTLVTKPAILIVRGASTEQAEIISRDVHKRLPGTWLVCVGHLDDVDAFDEKTMAKHGWCRIDSKKREQELQSAIKDLGKIMKKTHLDR